MQLPGEKHLPEKLKGNSLLFNFLICVIHKKKSFIEINLVKNASAKSQILATAVA